MPKAAVRNFKESGPVIGANDEHGAAVVLVTFAAQIAESAKAIQGARHDRLGNAEQTGEAAHRVRPGGKIDKHEQCHLPVGEIGLA